MRRRNSAPGGRTRYPLSQTEVVPNMFNEHHLHELHEDLMVMVREDVVASSTMIVLPDHDGCGFTAS